METTVSTRMRRECPAFSFCVPVMLISLFLSGCVSAPQPAANTVEAKPARVEAKPADSAPKISEDRMVEHTQFCDHQAKWGRDIVAAKIRGMPQDLMLRTLEGFHPPEVKEMMRQHIIGIYASTTPLLYVIEMRTHCLSTD